MLVEIVSVSVVFCSQVKKPSSRVCHRVVRSIMWGAHGDSTTVASLHRLEFYRHKGDWQLCNKESPSPPQPTEKARRPASASRGPRTPTVAPPPARGRGRGYRKMAAVFPQPAARESRRSQFEAHCGARKVDLDVTYSVESDGSSGASPPPGDRASLSSAGDDSSMLNTAFLAGDAPAPEPLAGSHRQHRALSLASLPDEAAFLAGAAARGHSSPAAPRRSYASVAKASQAVPAKDRPPLQVNDPQLLFKLLSPGSKNRDQVTEDMNYEENPLRNQDDCASLQKNTSILKNDPQNVLYQEDLVSQDRAYDTNVISQYPMYHTDLVPQYHEYFSDNIYPNNQTYFSEENPFEPLIFNDVSDKAYVQTFSENQENYDFNNVRISECYPQSPDNEYNTWDMNNNHQNETRFKDSKNLPLIMDSYFDDTPKKQLSVDSPEFYPYMLHSGISKPIPQSEGNEPHLDSFMRMFTETQQQSEDTFNSDAQNWMSNQYEDNVLKVDSGPFKGFKPVFPHMGNLNANQNNVNDIGYGPGIPNTQNKQSELTLFPNRLNEPNVKIDEEFYKKTSVRYRQAEKVEEVTRERNTSQDRQQNIFATNCHFINFVSCNPGQQAPFGNIACSDYNLKTQHPFNQTRNENNPSHRQFSTQTINDGDNAGFPKRIPARDNRNREIHNPP